MNLAEAIGRLRREIEREQMGGSGQYDPDDIRTLIDALEEPEDHEHVHVATAAFMLDDVGGGP